MNDLGWMAQNRNPSNIPRVMALCANWHSRGSEGNKEIMYEHATIQVIQFGQTDKYSVYNSDDCSVHK